MSAQEQLDRANTNVGFSCLIYGPYGIGKTFSAGTLPEPACIIGADPRNIERVLKRFIKAKRDLTISYTPPFDPKKPQLYYEKQIELFNKWETQASEGTFPYRSVMYDGSSYAMLEIKTLVEDGQHEMTEFAENERAVFLVGPKKDKGTGYVLYNQLGSAMIRITKRLTALSKYNVLFIMTALIDSDAFPEKPFFLGNLFPSIYGGMFDFIGRVFTKKEVYTAFNIKNNDGKGYDPSNPWPPYVVFNSPDNEFEAKCCDDSLLNEQFKRQGGAYAPLNFEKIVSKMKG